MSRDPALPDPHDRFTPETHPGFTQEVCDLLNTPVEELDPVLLALVLGVFARHLAEELPPELGMNAEALFSTLWDRLGAPLGQPAPDAAAGEQADAAPASPAPALADMPPPEAAAPGAADHAAIAAASATPAGILACNPHVFRGRWQTRGPRQRFGGFRGFLARIWRDRRLLLPPSPRLYDACAGPP